MAVRAIRGATQVDADDREEILAATRELVSTVMERNDLEHDDVISILFTATPDLTSEFPALAARELGMGDVPLMCATEIDVPHALPRVLRLMAHVETPRPRSAIQHVYLRGAAPCDGTSPSDASPSTLPRAGDPRRAVRYRQVQRRPRRGPRLGAAYLDTGAMYRAAPSPSSTPASSLDDKDAVARAVAEAAHRGGHQRPPRGASRSTASTSPTASAAPR